MSRRKLKHMAISSWIVLMLCILTISSVIAKFGWHPEKSDAIGNWAWVVTLVAGMAITSTIAYLRAK